jgi:hypothetical protein
MDSVVALERHEAPLSLGIVFRARSTHRFNKLGETVQALEIRLPRADKHPPPELFGCAQALGEPERCATPALGQRDIDDVLMARMGRDLEALGVDESRGPTHFTIDPAQSELLAVRPSEDGAVRAILPELDFTDRLLEVSWTAPSCEVPGLDERIEDEVTRSTKKPCHEHVLPAQRHAECIFRNHRDSSLLHAPKSDPLAFMAHSNTHTNYRRSAPTPPAHDEFRMGAVEIRAMQVANCHAHPCQARNLPQLRLRRAHRTAACLAILPFYYVRPAAGVEPERHNAIFEHKRGIMTPVLVTYGPGALIAAT